VIYVENTSQNMKENMIIRVILFLRQKQNAFGADGEENGAGQNILSTFARSVNIPLKN
jgi:hypothetical protein